MRDPYFPFHALGFHSNPFRALTDEEWADIVVLPPAVLDAAAGANHLQILGEMGRGKTSTLLGLAQQARQAGRQAVYEYLTIGQDRFNTALPGLEVFLLDEAQRLHAAERRRLLAAAQSGLRVILGSHEDLAPLFATAGLRLLTVRLEAFGLGHLAAVLERRLAAAAIPGRPPIVTLDSGALPYLADTFGTNLRRTEHFLYEVFQRLEMPGPLTVETLQAFAAAHPETIRAL
jgi:hypothetical protein